MPEQYDNSESKFLDGTKDGWGQPAQAAANLLQSAACNGSSAHPFCRRLLLECQQGAAVIGRHVAAQARADRLVGLTVDSSVLVEEGHQIAPAVGDENIERDEACHQIIADAA